MSVDAVNTLLQEKVTIQTTVTMETIEALLAAKEYSKSEPLILQLLQQRPLLPHHITLRLVIQISQTFMYLGAIMLDTKLLQGAPGVQRSIGAVPIQ